MKVNLIFLKKDGSTEFFLLPSTVTTIGRREDCDFCIPLSSVSRRHCEIDLDRGKVMIRDLKSRNGTLINGKQITESEVNAGDVLKIGPIEFIVQVNGIPADADQYVPEKPKQQPVAESAAAAAAGVSEAAGPAKYATETQEAEFDIDQDLAELDPGRSQTVDFDHGLKGFDLDNDLDLDTEISNL